jgi:hypothetical protein
MSMPNDPGGFPPQPGGGSPSDESTQQTPAPTPGQPPAYTPPAYTPPAYTPPEAVTPPETPPAYQPPYSAPGSAPVPQPPVYGQPAYGAPGSPPVYGQQPPVAPPPKKSRRVLWTVLGTIAALVIVACVACGGLFAYGIAQAKQPLDAAGQFCNALKAQNYSSAYTMLSTGYQNQVTQEQFVQASQLHDQIDGPVQSCGLANTSANSSTNFQFNLNQNTATFNVQIVRNKSYTGSVSMVKQGSAWKVDKIDPALQGTDLGPLEVANSYCQGLLSGNLAQSYNDLSTSFQSNFGSEQAFEQTFKASFGSDLKLTACTPKLSSYSVTGTTATLDATLTVQVSANGTTASQDLPVTMNFVMEGNAWKVDSLKVNS